MSVRSGDEFSGKKSTSSILKMTAASDLAHLIKILNSSVGEISRQDGAKQEAFVTISHLLVFLRTVSLEMGLDFDAILASARD